MDVIDFLISMDTRNSYLLFQETKGEAFSTLPLRLFRTDDFVQSLSLRVKKERGKTAKQWFAVVFSPSTKIRMSIF